MSPGATRRGEPIREREFHEWLARHLPSGRAGLLPIGDDAAALPTPRGRVAVLTTDSLVEGTHFLRDSPPGRIGAASVAVSLSDLAAKGAEPAAILLAVIVPPGTPVGWARSLVEGAERCAERFGASIAGGDTKPGPARTVVSFGLGWGRAERLAPHTGAQIGDVVVTTGTVGRGGVAAAHLADGVPSRPSALAELVEIRPRVREGIALSQWAHAMVDTSDGIALASKLLADASGVRIVIEERQLPEAPGLARYARDLARRRAILFFGGDYELLATLAPRSVAAATRAVTSVGGRLATVGRIERGRGAVLDTTGGRMPMPSPIWQPFAPRGRALP